MGDARAGGFQPGERGLLDIGSGGGERMHAVAPHPWMPIGPSTAVFMLRIKQLAVPPWRLAHSTTPAAFGSFPGQ